MTGHPGPADGLRLLVMGVSGCGKSTLASRVAELLGGALIEGDDFHPPVNVDKMRRGIALEDADRLPWLDLLGERLAKSHGPTVLTCSALKRSYRARLRTAVPGLRIVFIELDLDEATRRLDARQGHFFHPRLVVSQFAALESPMGEAGVFRVEATLPQAAQAEAVTHWLRAGASTAIPSISSHSDRPIP